jgi:nicotinate-nucleotide--dimethylbenzimidazole phosphoribosyltransferase
MDALDRTRNDIQPLAIDPDRSIQARLDSLTKPPGSLGRLEELAKWFVSIRAGGFTDAASCPRPEKKAVYVMAGDHGVVAQGVSAFPQEVTPQMVVNFLRGGAGINVLARCAGAEVTVVDCGVAAQLEPHERLLQRKIAFGTADMCAGPAMSPEQARAAVRIGIDCAEKAAEEGVSLLATGDMGIGNTTPSAAILAAFTGADPATVVGRGTGVDDEGLARKAEAIRTAIAANRPDPDDALDVLAKVGGFEIGAIAGLCLGGARHRIPVLVDGFISSAGALVATRLCPQAKGYLAGSHLSAEAGHAGMLDAVGLPPLLSLDFRLGEGTGAAVAMHLVDDAVAILAEMATFADAGVSEGGS